MINMTFKFYNQLTVQPDLQDIVQYISEPLQILENLKTRLDNLPSDHRTNFAEVLNKVERLINKHFPDLTEDYCRLSLDYRNTAIIKKEHFEGQLHEYTSKDILLKNFSKLIEEIYILEHNFNENYSHKLLISHRVVEQMGVQKTLVNTERKKEAVQPVVLKNQFDYNHFKKSEPKPEVVHVTHKVIEKETEVKDTTEKSSVCNISLFEVTLIFCFIALALLMFLSSKLEQSNKAAQKISQFEILSNAIEENFTIYKNINIDINQLANKRLTNANSIKHGKYNNTFDGQIIVASNSINNVNDSFFVAATNIPFVLCPQIVTGLNSTIKNTDKVLVNETLVVQNGSVDMDSVINSCNLDNSNTIKLISG